MIDSFSEEHQKLLDKIRDGLQKATSDIQYKFSDNATIGMFQTNLMDFIKNLKPYGKITEEINKTGIPDESLLLLLEHMGCYAESIYDFVEIDKRWEYSDDRRSVRLVIDTKFREPDKIQYVIDIPLNSKEERG